MGRTVAIDVGQKRIGLAVSDPLGIIATGLDTVHVSGIFEFLVAYAEREKIDLFIIGEPAQMNNKPSDSVKFVRPFIKRLKRTFPSIPVRMVDERFTSKLAKQAMILGGLKKEARKNREMVDKISSVILLQSFLDQKKL